MEGEEQERLISPCAGCRGSAAFVHFTCLLKFYRTRQDWPAAVCPSCKHAYEGEAAVALLTEGVREAERQGPGLHAATLTNLGNAYGDLGYAAKQRDLLERALEIEEREYGRWQ